MHFVNLCLTHIKARSISGASFKPYLMSQRSSITLCKEQGDNSYASRNKSSILIYGGEGSSEDSRKLCYDALLKVVDSRYHAIEYISPEEIKEGTWTKNCCLIAFGGGYDLGFINALGQKGTHIIRDFVQQGGSYLGFCAGAYWACNYIEFDKGGSLEVVGERFLKFFPGNCIGPAYPGFDYKNKKGVHAVPVSYKGVLFRSYLHGGGIFTQPRKSLENKESTSDSSQKGIKGLDLEYNYNLTIESPHNKSISSPENMAVTNILSEEDKSACQRNQILLSSTPLAQSANNLKGKGKHESISDYAKDTYEILGAFTSLDKNPAAFVKCSVGRGKVILSAVHIEFPAALLDQNNTNLKPVLPVLRQSEEARDFVFRDILLQVHVRLKPGKSLL